MFGFSRMGAFEINCDAPSYKVVQACRRIGFENPEDVRWCRRSEFVHHAEGWRGLFHSETWKRLLGGPRSQHQCCSCGHKLPSLDRVTFTFTTGHEASYLLGQCGGCRTVFWDDV
jgi:hypothetical protein